MSHKKPKRRDIHPDTGLIFWGMNKGKEDWVTSETFERRRSKINDYHRKNYDKIEKNTNKQPYKFGYINPTTGLVFWRFRSDKEYWVDKDTFAIRLQKKRESFLRFSEKNKEKRRIWAKEHREKNLDKERERKRDFMAKFREANREEYNRKSSERNCRRTKERMEFDHLFAMKLRFVSATSYAFRRKDWTKKSKTAELLGCEWSHLKTHIESLFRDGMSWENKNKWHIDHIIPLASAKNADELAKLCHYTNLQPLWAIENIIKGSKLPS
jgi:hypothetical protein